jgi:hypothetical protein
MANSEQVSSAPRKFSLGTLGTLSQVIKALSKTIRAMADGTLDSQVGARICNGLGIMRACLETQKLEQLEERVEKIIDHVPKRITHTEEDERYPFSQKQLENRRTVDEAERYSN